MGNPADLRAAVFKIALLSCLAFSTATQLTANVIPCWTRCRHPPAITSAQQMAPALRSMSNPPLTFLQRATGVVTTYCGKIWGIQGWRNYQIKAQVSGIVTHAAGSTDGLYTIDVRITELTLNHQKVSISRPSFIRIEVFPLVRFGAPLPRYPDEDVCIAGGLYWDADGFLEIHPSKSRDVFVGKCATRSDDVTK
jgi:hypothetical protein